MFVNDGYNSDSIPITFIFWFIAFAANEQPAIKPPPPTGTKSMSISLQSDNISYEIVPCPAITFKSL